MESDVEGAILDVLAGMPDARCQRVGSLWRVSVGGLSGARKDGIGLARDLRAQYEYRKAREAGMVPDPPPERPAYRDNPAQARKIAELQAALAAASAPKPEPVGKHVPPPEIADLIVMHDTPAQNHERLMRLFMEAKQSEEIARRDGGTNGSFNGKTTMEWLRKAEHYESGIKWNRGRLSEVI